jgi:hypothetical protein
MNSTITGRARRASARNHNGAASTPGTSQGEAPVEVGGSSLSQPLLVASEAYVTVPDDESSLSCSPSPAAQPSLPGIGANHASLQDERHNRPWCTLSPCELARCVSGRHGTVWVGTITDASVSPSHRGPQVHHRCPVFHHRCPAFHLRRRLGWYLLHVLWLPTLHSSSLACPDETSHSYSTNVQIIVNIYTVPTTV